MHARIDRVIPGLFVLLWSTGFLGARYGTPYAEPLTFLAIRYACVIVLLGALAVMFRAPWPRASQVGHIAIAGILLHACYLGGVFVAIRYGLSTGLTALIVGLQPILTALFAARMLGEAVSWRQWLGLLLGLTGVALVVQNKVAFGADPAHTLVPILIALAAITAGTLYQKRFCPSFDLRTGSIIQFTASLLVTAPLAWAWEGRWPVWTAQFTFALAWLVLVLSIGAISLLNLLIRRGEAVKVASLFYLTPPTTAVLAYFCFGETLSGMALAGMALAVGGVALARRT